LADGIALRLHLLGVDFPFALTDDLLAERRSVKVDERPSESRAHLERELVDLRQAAPE
jgi:hypothetical protein